jgi:hypothetical protein
MSIPVRFPSGAPAPAQHAHPGKSRRPRLRVLCLHGFRTSGAIMRDQVRATRERNSFFLFCFFSRATGPSAAHPLPSQNKNKNNHSSNSPAWTGM